jgi:GntR family transcriptional regulator
MVDELGESLQVPVQLVPMEQLMAVLDQTTSATLVTSRYFIGEVEAMAALKAVRVIPLDIHDYGKELTVVKGLPKSSCIGVISPSSGILRATEVILHGLRGDELLVITAQPKDAYKLQAMVKRSEIIFCTDQISYCTAQATIQTLSEDLIRTPKLIRCENYIGIQSINLLQRELGLI